MSDKEAVSVFAKPLNLIDNVIDFDNRENILRRNELAKITDAEDYARHLRGLVKKEREDTLEDCNRALEKKKDALDMKMVAQMYKSIKTFHDEQERYLAAVEEQCRKVVGQAFMALVGETPDEQRLTVLVRQAVSQISGVANATLKCHPSQAESLHKLGLPKYWSLEALETIEKNTFSVLVPLGEYYFSFKDDIEAIREVFRKL